MVDLDELLRFAIHVGASDLHVKVGSRPRVRIDGRLEETEFTPINPSDTERIAFTIMPKHRADEFIANSEADFAYAVPGLGRFRVNVFRQRGTVGMVFRRVVPGIPNFEDLGLPTAVRKLSEEHHGLVLVCGPAGSGTTTTLASMVDHINQTQARHIVTIEDPIEVLHKDHLSIINQREIGTDTDNYATAMKRIIRQDPDVILIGELGDLETAKSAIAAAETGHLVLSTLHTTNATETIHKIVDMFPEHQQKSARMMLASSLKGIICQKLITKVDGLGRVPACEVMTMTSRIFDRIVDPGDHALELEDIIADGEYYGMHTLDQSLLQLFGDSLVTRREALGNATNPTELRATMESIRSE
ncbi:MAG TPA: PilT/PilU family type 4a pilus ATPase [Acidimicrobiia bacterium]|nr:PilT/PilU family type 4a pilus ATPase [Acidimicrobiia bacterium]